MPYSGIPANKTKDVESCVSQVMAKGHSKSSAIAICHASIMKEHKKNYIRKKVKEFIKK